MPYMWEDALHVGETLLYKKRFKCYTLKKRVKTKNEYYIQREEKTKILLTITIMISFNFVSLK